jgi:hypothetical protein
VKHQEHRNLPIIAEESNLFSFVISLIVTTTNYRNKYEEKGYAKMKNYTLKGPTNPTKETPGSCYLCMYVGISSRFIQLHNDTAGQQSIS